MAGRVIQGFFIGRGLPAPTAGQARATASRPKLAAPPTPAFVGRIVAQLREQPVANFGDQILDPANLGLARGGGQQLPAVVLAKMEAAFGADFSAVRVHVGPQAARIGAVAFTTGTDLYFAPGQYQPHSARGQQLIGHELAHVIQQRQGRVRTPAQGVAVVRDRALEAEADRLGTLAAAYRPAGAAPVQAKMAAPLIGPLRGIVTRPGPVILQAMKEEEGRKKRKSITEYDPNKKSKKTYRISTINRIHILEILGNFALTEKFKINDEVEGWVVQLIKKEMKAYALDDEWKKINLMSHAEVDNITGGKSRLSGWEYYWEYLPIKKNGVAKDGDQFAMAGVDIKPNSDVQSAGEFTQTGWAYFTTKDPGRTGDKWRTDEDGPAAGWSYMKGEWPHPSVVRESEILKREVKVKWNTEFKSRLTLNGGLVEENFITASELNRKLGRKDRMSREDVRNLQDRIDLLNLD